MGEDFPTCQENTKSFGANFGTNFGANFGEIFGNFEPNLGARKAHKHLAHKQFLGHPGHRSSRPGARSSGRMPGQKCLYSHRSGDPWPPAGRETPGHPGSHRKICLCLCAFSFPENFATFLETSFSRRAVLTHHRSSKNTCQTIFLVL